MSLFLSHSWQKDTLGRDTHKRVKQLKKELAKLGWSVWLDEDNMGLNLDASMVHGIEHSNAFIVCLTQSYFTKLNRASNDLHLRSDCLKEFTYANARGKVLLCVMFEPFKKWPEGVLSMYLPNLLHIDASRDCNMSTVAHKLTCLLKRESIYPNNKKAWQTLWYQYNQRAFTKTLVRQLGRRRTLRKVIHI